MSIMVFVSCGPKKDPNLTYFDNPVSYNDYIIGEQMDVFDMYDKLLKELNEGTAATIGIAYDDFCNRSNQAYDNMNKLADFKKNTEFRDAAKDLFKFYSDVCQKELGELVDIYSKGTGLTEDEFNRADEITIYIQENEKKKNDILIDKQLIFAKKNNLSLK